MNNDWINRRPTVDECNTFYHAFVTVEDDGKRKVFIVSPRTALEEWELWNVVAWMPFEYPEPYKGEV
jgi:hypothetical protein